jgi:Trp operon repressor
MSTAPELPPTTAYVPITSADEGERLTTHFVDVIDALIGVVQEETELVSGGQLGAAAKLYEPKGNLTRLYLADALRLRASHPYLSQFMSPDKRDALRQRHESFRALLQVNLTVLATAHAVSEGIVRGVSGELTRKAAPQTYGASGRTVTAGASAAQPIALSRIL